MTFTVRRWSPDVACWCLFACICIYSIDRCMYASTVQQKLVHSLCLAVFGGPQWRSGPSNFFMLCFFTNWRTRQAWNWLAYTSVKSAYRSELSLFNGSRRRAKKSENTKFHTLWNRPEPLIDRSALNRRRFRSGPEGCPWAKRHCSGPINKGS